MHWTKIRALFCCSYGHRYPAKIPVTWWKIGILLPWMSRPRSIRGKSTLNYSVTMLRNSQVTSYVNYRPDTEVKLSWSKTHIKTGVELRLIQDSIFVLAVKLHKIFQYIIFFCVGRAVGGKVIPKWVVVYKQSLIGSFNIPLRVIQTQLL